MLCLYMFRQVFQHKREHVYRRRQARNPSAYKQNAAHADAISSILVLTSAPTLGHSSVSVINAAEHRSAASVSGMQSPTATALGPLHQPHPSFLTQLKHLDLKHVLSVIVLSASRGSPFALRRSAVMRSRLVYGWPRRRAAGWAG